MPVTGQKSLAPWKLPEGLTGLYARSLRCDIRQDLGQVCVCLGDAQHLLRMEWSSLNAANLQPYN